MQKRSEEHSSPKRRFFLPSSAAYFFPNPPPQKKTFHFFHIQFSSYLRHCLLFLVLHACSTELTTDFRRSRPSLPASTSMWISFSSSHVLTHRTNPRPLLFLLLLMSFVQHTQLMQGSIFTPLRMSIKSAIQTMMPPPSPSMLASVMQQIHEPVDKKRISTFWMVQLIDWIVHSHDCHADLHTHGRAHAHTHTGRT